MRRSFHRCFHLRPGEVTNADHADIAIRPSLLRSPLDEIVHVAALLAVEKAKGSTGTARTPAIRDDVDITAGDEEISGARFNKACWGTEILNLPRIGSRSNQHWVLAMRSRTVHIHQQRNTIAHGHENIVVVSHFEGRLRQIAIVEARRLWTVE